MAVPLAFSQTLVWHFDDMSTPLAATDSSGNGRTGSINGNVTSTSNGVSGNAFNGFNSATSEVYFNTTGLGGIVNNPISTSKNVSLALWLQNPGSQSRNVIAGFGTNATSGNNSLQLWASAEDGNGQRTVGLTWGNWNGQHTVFESVPITWETNTWYQLAFVIKNTTSQTYSFDIYLTKQGEGVLGAPLLSGITPTGATGPANGSIFYVGGQPQSFSNTKPNPLATGGYWGGSIDEVSLWLGEALTKEQLSANFAQYPIPELATTVLLCGLIGLIATSAIRRR